jgi:hypothetical protein
VENEQLREQLTESVDQAEWDWLAPHAGRDALVVVDTALDLVEVGVAIASDNTPSVQHWIDEQLIYKPSAEQLTRWERDRHYRFKALIVQPYVLMQDSVSV